MAKFNRYAGRNQSKIKDKQKREYFQIIKLCLLCLTFYLGMQSGISNSNYSNEKFCAVDSKNWKFDKTEIDKIVSERINIVLKKNNENLEKTGKQNDLITQETRKRRFGKETSRFAVGLAKVTRREFLDNFDNGFPETYDDTGMKNVIILYNSEKSLPTNEERRSRAMYNDGIGIPILGVHEATENCKGIDVIVTDAPMDKKQCIGIISNFQSFHLQKWMRSGPVESGITKLDMKNPLRHVGRGMQANGRDQFQPPSKSQIRRNWKQLQVYFNSLDETIQKLKPIVSKVERDNTVVVMVCNFGQSVLLQNFVCSAKSRSIDIENVIVFATDPETLRLAQGLGLSAFYDEKNFESLPSKEAKDYGDSTFAAMMYAKVVSVQLVNSLGVNVLFQDVDIVWYQNPLPLFNDKESEFYDYDMLFQDDGARSVRYAPYCANSGFYFVRYNDRTRYLLTSLLYSGDMIIQSGSHQQALNALIIEHTSLYGLKVKTLDGDDFPGGFHYHRRKELMHNIVENKSKPWIFHMSWTKNKDNKLLFFKQMGLWNVQAHCIDSNALAMLDKFQDSTSSYLESCCSAQPLISCHYSDKPSIIPCKTSPPIDNGGRSFWS